MKQMETILEDSPDRAVSDAWDKMFDGIAHVVFILDNLVVVQKPKLP